MAPPEVVSAASGRVIRYTLTMPMYEYACRACGHQFEKLVKTFDAAKEAAECPSCHSKQTGRELSVFAVGADGAKAPAPTGGGCACGGPGPCGMD